MDYTRFVKISAMNEKNDIILLLIGRLDFIDYTNFNYQGRYTDGELPKCVGEGRVLSAESYHLSPPTPHEKRITTRQKRQSNFSDISAGKGIHLQRIS